MAQILRGGGVHRPFRVKIPHGICDYLTGLELGELISMKLEKSRVSLDALGIGAIIMIGTLASASSVKAATAKISASATIVPPVALAERSDIRFSGFVAGARAGTITLLVPSTLPEAPPTSQTPIAGSERLADGGTRLVGGAKCLGQRNCGVGALQISGPPSDSFSGVSSQIAATLTSGDNTMTLGDIEMRYGANGTAGVMNGPGMLNRDGSGTIVIGGVLTVAAGQAMGNYTGNLAVSVDY